VIHVNQDGIRIFHNLMTVLTLNVGYETNPATVVLKPRIIEALWQRWGSVGI
jgi:hypothetical protein